MNINKIGCDLDIQKLDLDDQAHFNFLDMCKKYKVKPMTTIFSRSSDNFLIVEIFILLNVSGANFSSLLVQKEHFLLHASIGLISIQLINGID